MKEISNIVKLRTHRWSIDWAYEEEVEINLDDYVFFACEYRTDDWHLIGYKHDKKTDKWTTEELSIHWCFEREIAEFIYKANKYEREKQDFPIQHCKVSRFNNLHYGGGFYKSLQKIFDMVKQMEEADHPTEKGGAE